MRFPLTLFLAFLFSLSVFSQEFKESDLPLNVINAFKDKFNSPEKVSWNKKGDIFVASFKLKSQNLKVDFTNDGKWIDTKYELGYKETPVIITSYVDLNFVTAKIKEQYLVEYPTGKDSYYIVLAREDMQGKAELYFDLEGNLTKQNVPESFCKNTASELNAKNAPPIAYNAFRQKYPNALLQTWKKDSTLFIATFIQEGLTGKAEFTLSGVWHNTKFTISEKEMPTPILSDLKQHYNDCIVRSEEMIQEPSVNDYYYIYAKKENSRQAYIGLFYAISGKFIKKIDYDENGNSGNLKSNIFTDNIKITDTVETVSIKELPTSMITFIKNEYPGYAIKEAILNASDNNAFYHVKVKDEASRKIKELIFDIQGNLLETKEVVKQF